MWWCRSELEIGVLPIEVGAPRVVNFHSLDCILPFEHEGRLYYKCGAEMSPGKFFCLVKDKNRHDMRWCKPDQQIQLTANLPPEKLPGLGCPRPDLTNKFAGGCKSIGKWQRERGLVLTTLSGSAEVVYRKDGFCMQSDFQEKSVLRTKEILWTEGRDVLTENIEFCLELCKHRIVPDLGQLDVGMSNGKVAGCELHGNELEKSLEPGNQWARIETKCTFYQITEAEMKGGHHKGEATCWLLKQNPLGKPADRTFKCVGANDCCSVPNPCEEGEGACNSNTHCKGSLVCGKEGSSCKGSSFDRKDRCCVKPTCTSSQPCGEGEGICKRDADCQGDLKCSNHLYSCNLLKFNPSDRCCVP